MCPSSVLNHKQTLAYSHGPSTQYWTGHSSKNTHIEKKEIIQIKSCFSIMKTSCFQWFGELPCPRAEGFHKAVHEAVKRRACIRKLGGSPVTLRAAVLNICRGPAELQDAPGASAKSPVSGTFIKAVKRIQEVVFPQSSGCGSLFFLFLKSAIFLPMLVPGTGFTASKTVVS